MDVEYIFTRKNGERLAIAGKVKMQYRCACNGGDHMHALDVIVDSVIDVETELPVLLDPHEVMEVEQEMADIAYDEAAS